MWLDLIKNNKNYLPHKIVALNKICAGDYKKVTKKRNIYLNRKDKKTNIFLNLRKNKKKAKKK